FSGSVQNTTTYSISQNISGVSGKTIGLRAVDHPSVITGSITYSEDRVNRLRSNGIAGFQVMDELGEWGDSSHTEPVDNGDIHILADYVLGTRCSVGCN